MRRLLTGIVLAASLLNAPAGAQIVWPGGGSGGGGAATSLDAGGATSITNGVSTQCLYDNAGVVGVQACGTGTGNALFGTATGNTANDIVTMSNTTVGLQDSGVLLSSLAPKASPTFTGSVTLPNSVIIGAGAAITSSGAGGALGTGAFAAAAPCTAFGTAAGTCAQGGVITAGGPTGSATVAPIITYNAAGQLTTVGSATITPAVGSVTGLGNNVATALGNTAGGAGGFALVSGANVASVSNSDGTLTISPTTGAVVASINLANANTWTGAQTISDAPFSLTGNQSIVAWTTNGARYKNVAGTLTDTTSSGTVAAAYTDVWGGNTIAASSATTYTNYITSYFKAPAAGTNVTFTKGWALGADSLLVAGNFLSQVAGSTGNNTGTLLNPSATTNAVNGFSTFNDTSGGEFQLLVENSATANTTLVNIPHSTVLLARGVSTGGLMMGTNGNSANVVLFAGGSATATNVGLTVSGTSQGVTLGSATPAAGQRGDLAQIKETDAAAAPGAGYSVVKWVAGTNAGTCKLIGYAGTSATPVTIVDNVGAGC